MDRFHAIHDIERKTSKSLHVVRVRLTDIQATSIPDDLFMARRVMKYVEKP